MTMARNRIVGACCNRVDFEHFLDKVLMQAKQMNKKNHGHVETTQYYTQEVVRSLRTPSIIIENTPKNYLLVMHREYPADIR